MIETPNLPVPDKQKILNYYTRPQIAQLLIEQVTELYYSELGGKFTFSLAEGLHLYIYFHRRYLQQQQQQGEQIQGEGMRKQQGQQEHGCYAIKITKSFPLEGVRVHVLKNNHTPRLFDCRDLTDDILQGGWSYKNRLLDILHNIGKIQSKLALRSGQDIAMQGTGEFKMGDLFDIHELKVFSALYTFRDETREDGPMLGVTETHFLTFKQIPNKNNGNSKDNTTHKKLYQLVRACQLQCISQFFHNKKNGQIILTFYKYKTIKSFNQHQKISRKYKLQQSQLFLRHVLKNITRFQKVDIGLQLGSGWNGEPSYEKISRKLEEIREAEEMLGQTADRSKEREKMQVGQQLIGMYHKIVEYFSERANPYYLIFVNKLNKMGSYSEKIQSNKSY